MKVIIFGSNGLVGSSISRILENSAKVDQIIKSNRSELDLFKKDDVEEFIKDYQPNVIINAAARVGGINANNTHRTEFIIENLKINMNILESIVDYPNVKVINLGSSCIYPLDSPNPIKEEVSKEESEEIKTKVEASGASVEIS